MDPNWFGSPQHLVATLALATAIAFLASRRWNCPRSVAAGLGLGAGASGEIAYELVEYPLRYKDEVHATAYQDTLADLANSLFGGALGGAIGAWLGHRG